MPTPKTANQKKRARVVAEARANYRARHATPTYDLRENVAEELPRAVERIVHALHPEKIVLFGSYAYGTPTRDSDVDLLVIWNSAAPRKERNWAVAQHLVPRVFALDLLVRTPEEIKSALGKGDFFLREIITRGKVLYERSN